VLSIYYEDYLTVADLKEYEYCPAIPWINRNLGYVTEATPSMDLGKARASREFKVRVAEELSLPKPYRVEVPVVSRRLRVRGVVDLVAGDRRLAVVEVKAFKRRRDRARHFRLQLAAYALLANESLGPVRHAILYLGGDVVRLDVTRDLLVEAESKIRRLWEVVGSEKPPVVRQPPGKCLYCWYRRVCPVSSS